MSKSRADEYYLDPKTGKTEAWVKSSVPLMRPDSMPFAHNVVKWSENGSTFKRKYDATGKPIIDEYYSQTGGTNKNSHKKPHKKSHKKSHKQSPRKSRRNYHK